MGSGGLPEPILRNLPGMTLNNIGPDVGHPTAYNEAMLRKIA
jgi:hypothetical protein